MHNKSYGKLCSLFYDTTKQFASEKEVAFYEQFINENSGKVLEAMSGSGRLQIPLLQKGYDVEGIDNSRIMLDRCHQRAEKFNISPITYEQSLEDMNLPKKYSTVTIAVGSFQLITNRDIALKCLKNLNKHMVKNGNILIDFFIPETTSRLPFIREAIINDNTKIVLTTKYKFDTKVKKAVGFCNYQLIENNNVVEKEDELIEVCWYSKEEMVSLIEEAGFEFVNIYNERLRYSADSLILHAKKI